MHLFDKFWDYTIYGGCNFLKMVSLLIRLAVGSDGQNDVSFAVLDRELCLSSQCLDVVVSRHLKDHFLLGGAAVSASTPLSERRIALQKTVPT